MHMVIVVPKTKYLERRFYLYCFVHEKEDNMKIEKIPRNTLLDTSRKEFI